MGCEPTTLGTANGVSHQSAPFFAVKRLLSAALSLADSFFDPLLL